MSDIFVNCHIETERLILRPNNMDDAPFLQKIVSNPKVLEYLPYDPASLEEVKDIITWSTGCLKRNTKEKIEKLNLSVIERDTNTVIGWCGLGPADWDLAQTEIYYTIAEEHWGKGFASETSCALRDYAFKTIGLKKLVGVVAVENIASNKVLKKLGMEHLGCLEIVPEDCDSYFIGQNLYSLNA